MKPAFVLDGVKFGIPFHKFTGWTLQRTLDHKEGREFLVKLKQTLSTMPTPRPALVELYNELKAAGL